ncbi:lipoprotein-attachment site-containing protein [Moraxella cuniculi DSM 21768]|uniref:Lipoprotein-attachment site-containing protein n=1 Tax=Moraxella cuniculi DSM 21768 TaxID=1122245 RepID=A0A1N7FNY4_9GAMM|nr:lipoprotein [Moraxella cuniculi]OOS04739.1 hypothetical protein B0189_08045 [Moraxella cuniculi]SIS02072.1 lipoprotein-attachment site-containing protein [Moraxella cuniculi DSM 21768]
MKKILPCLVLITLITGCGQKGALYLPNSNPVIDTTPASSDPNDY